MEKTARRSVPAKRSFHVTGPTEMSFAVPPKSLHLEEPSFIPLSQVPLPPPPPPSAGDVDLPSDWPSYPTPGFSWKIGEYRYVQVKKSPENQPLIRIYDSVTEKRALFTKARLQSMLHHVDEVRKSITLIRDDYPYVNLRVHYGLAWHLSVSYGFDCVDMRKFYIDKRTGRIRPTKDGLALRFPEWQDFVERVVPIMTTVLDLNDIVGCLHVETDEFAACKECNPFGLKGIENGYGFINVDPDACKY